MARDFDGTNDNIGFGSDASIDDFSALTIAAIVKWDGGGAGDIIIGKANNASAGWRMGGNTANDLGLTREYSGGLAVWSSTITINGSTRAIVCSHDGVAANLPRMVFDGVADTVVADAASSGTLVADAANNMLAGESSSGTNDFDGALQNLVVHNAQFSTDEENRWRWWGVAPGGPSTVKVWHPFYTTDLVNKGTATATGTATGTTVVPLASPQVRPSSALMGMGIGW